MRRDIVGGAPPGVNTSPQASFLPPPPRGEGRRQGSHAPPGSRAYPAGMVSLPRGLAPSPSPALLLALMALAAGCGGSQEPAKQAGAGSRDAASPPGLPDEAATRGLDYLNRSGDGQKTDILAANGAGVALLDLESDGDLDVVFAQGLGSLQQVVTGPGADLEVFRNLGDGTFERAPGPGLSGWWTGLATGDIDGDGDADLVAGGYGGLEVLLQESDGSLRAVHSLSGPAPGARITPGEERAAGSFPEWVTSVALFDADRDGVLDLYAGQYLQLDPVAPVRGAIKSGALSVPCRWKGHEVYCGPRGLVPQPDRTFRGLGDGSFVETTSSWLADIPVGYTLAVLPSDVDADGDVDLLIANDSSENLLLINDGSGSFLNYGYEAGIAFSADGNPEAGMGLACGDVNRDGLFDYVVTNFSDEPTSLYLGSELGFENATFRYGLSSQTRALLSWSVHLVDLDGDGWLELFTANGHVYPQADEELTGTRYGQADTLWRLGPDLRATPIAAAAPDSILSPESGTRGAALGDVDGDGWPDLVLARIDAPCALGMNRMAGSPHGLVLHLSGPETPAPGAPRTPRDASGARAFVVIEQGGEEVTLVRELQTSQGYQSASSPALHFGLGAAEGYEHLAVRWPSGALTELPPGTADRALWIEEGRGLVREEPLR